MVSSSFIKITSAPQNEAQKHITVSGRIEDKFTVFCIKKEYIPYGIMRVIFIFFRPKNGVNLNNMAVYGYCDSL